MSDSNGELENAQAEAARLIDDVASQVMKPVPSPVKVHCRSCSSVIPMAFVGQKYCPPCATFKGVDFFGREPDGHTVKVPYEPPVIIAESQVPYDPTACAPPDIGGDPDAAAKLIASQVEKQRRQHAVNVTRNLKESEIMLAAKAKEVAGQLLDVAQLCTVRAAKIVAGEGHLPDPSAARSFVESAGLAIKFADDVNRLGDKAVILAAGKSQE